MPQMSRDGIHLMSVVITPDEKANYERERDLEVKEKARDWKSELYKMGASLAINVFCISVLIMGALYTTGDTSSRFMSLLEIVIGAIFGVTATQIAKG